MYSRTLATCTDAGSSYDIFTVHITSGQIEADIVQERSVFVTVDGAGDFT